MKIEKLSLDLETFPVLIEQSQECIVTQNLIILIYYYIVRNQKYKGKEKWDTPSLGRRTHSQLEYLRHQSSYH